MGLYGYIHKLNSGIMKGTNDVIKFPSSELKKSCPYVFKKSNITFDGNPVLEDTYKKNILDGKLSQRKLLKLCKWNLSIYLESFIISCIDNNIVYG